MNYLMNKIHRNNGEEGSAMITALLIMILMLFIVGTMTTFAIAGLKKGTDIKDIDMAAYAADSGISNALYLANNPGTNQGLDKHIGVANAVTGIISPNVSNPNGDGKYKWRWYAQSIPTSFEGQAYDIYATGYKNTPDEALARTFRVRLGSLPTNNAQYRPYGIFYSPTPVGVFTWGAFGSNGATIDNKAKVYSYDSRLVASPALSDDKGHGRVASNAKITYGVGSVFSELSFLASNIKNPAEASRCTGARCLAPTAVKYTYGVDLTALDNGIKAVCPAASYPDWIASKQGGTYAPETAADQCWGNIVFDVDTNIPYQYSSGAAAVMYATGSVTVKSGVEVNSTASTDGGPLKFRVYSLGGTAATVEAGSPVNPTKFTGLLEGSKLNCQIGKDTTSQGANATTLVYGAIACDTLTLSAGATLWWDEQTSQVLGTNATIANRVWSQVSYDEVQ